VTRPTIDSPRPSTRAWRAVASVALAAGVAGAQQVPDRDFRPPIARPAYETAKGPRLCLDEAHHNFHTLADRFWAFGELARRDGFRTGPLTVRFSASVLAACDLLVISNAQPSSDDWLTYPTPTPSAFADAEIAAVRAWVEGGGRLLLIADHMPFAGAAAKLAGAFGASFTDGFAYKAAPADAPEAAIESARATPTLFVPADGTLPAHPITRGRDSTERVTQVRSFTGQAFQVEGSSAEPVLVLPSDFVVLEPRYAWQFDATTRQRAVGGWLQGATRRVGRGRVALFGEAAMFSAQARGREKRPMGMNAPLAEQNAQFALNTLHWLMGLIEP
jgi:hypothetical protein